mgnify:FL=1
MSKPTKLLLALKNAKKHLEITTNQGSSNNHTTESELTTQPKSKLNRLTGGTYSSPTKRPSLLSRVGVANRPTYDLIADGVLGKNQDYRPKLSLNKTGGEVSSLVAERLKNLRERTLSKISNDTSIAESSFFGFESDGTPIWSSVVSGQRDIEEGLHHQIKQNKANLAHHSIQLPIIVDWPKTLEYSSHHTYKTWSVTTENRRATQLSERVIDSPQESLNPLILIGESQTGKSHLIHAIGQAVLLRNDGPVYFIRGDDLSEILAVENSWSDVFDNCVMLLIDDIDLILSDQEVANHVGRMLDYALNMKVHVVVTARSSPEDWPASSLWDILRGGVRSILGRVGAGSLMLYARKLSNERNLMLSDEQLALIVTDGDISWRGTRSGIDKIEAAIDSGEKLLDTVDVYKLLNDIHSDDEDYLEQSKSESVEDIANRLITSVIDVVYSDEELGGIEITTTLPELSNDYTPPEIDIESFIGNQTDLVEAHIKKTLDDLTPEAPSVIDVNDRDKHLVAKMTRIVKQDHAKAAEILTELDMGIDQRFANSDGEINQNTGRLIELESMLLNLANRTSDASLEGLIDIADELRELENQLVSLDPERGPLPEFVEDELDSYTPSQEWNIDSSKVTAESLIDNESITLNPIDGVLEPHPEGSLKTSIITPVGIVMDGEEE